MYKDSLSLDGDSQEKVDSDHGLSIGAEVMKKHYSVGFRQDPGYQF